MIIQSYYTNRNRRNTFQGRLEYQRAMEHAAAGAEVEVLVEGVYNSPKHKALPWADAGDVIRVATGPYLQALLADGLVKLTTDTAPAQQQTAEPSPVSVGAGTSPAEEAPVLAEAQESYEFLLGAGLGDRLARAVYDAGFTSKLAIQQSVLAAGLEGLTAVKGIGPQTAQNLADWANQ
ncbi:MAG: helix-hairpin-helix domain-containing protein [Caldilinea sp.]|nr:helix-hairpin-helix domain-containing protein [Caldilinea sp.]